MSNAVKLQCIHNKGGIFEQRARQERLEWNDKWAEVKGPMDAIKAVRSTLGTGVR